jgi:crotonobetainyl-CoA:carnitine CoA-transferase CaiB-like acyl-CoA transferase
MGRGGDLRVTGLPLDGVRVLDLSRLLPGGFCSLLLADFGADVLKVEDTGLGDYIRWATPYYEGVEDSAKSALFLALNRGKRSLRLNLKSADGREVLLRAVRESDVVLESFRPGVLDRLGVGYEAMREVNPAIVYCAITGYGQDGPNRDRSGHDMNYLGLVGLLGLTGDAGGPPVQAAGQIADLGGGALMAAFGILAALRERDRSGEGQLVDVSMADGALAWLALVAARGLAEDVAPRRGELELAGALVCYRPYECADGWVTLAALEPKFWQAWCRGVGREDLIEQQFSRPGSDTHRAVEAIFAARTREQWRAFASEHDCCLEPVLELDEALDSELVRAREMVVELDQPGAQRPVRLLGVPVKLSRTPGDPNRAPGPGLGEHTREVLAALGYDEQQVAALLESGAVAGPVAGTRGSFLS